MKEELYRAYQEKLGTPDQVFKEGDLDILVRLPIPLDELYDTIFTTIGLSELVDDDRYELILEVICEPSEYELIVKRITEFALQYAQNRRLNINETTTDFALLRSKPFLNNLLILASEFPSGFTVNNVFVKLIRVIPIYKEEAEVLKKISSTTLQLIEEKAKVDWSNPDRTPIDLVKTATANTWHYLKKWYKENSDSLYHQINTGIPRAFIDGVESKMGLSFTEDLKSSLEICNGFIGFFEYNYLNLYEIYDTWLTMKKLSEEGKFEMFQTNLINQEFITDTWWSTYWIPFAEDSGGNKLCIDVSPETKGIYGQVIYWEKNTGPEKSNFNSFIEWLDHQAYKLRRNMYLVGQDGFLEEKL